MELMFNSTAQPLPQRLNPSKRPYNCWSLNNVNKHISNKIRLNLAFLYNSEKLTSDQSPEFQNLLF